MNKFKTGDLVKYKKHTDAVVLKYSMSGKKVYVALPWGYSFVDEKNITLREPKA